jgi:predicted 2-oxoglutarate/Fe(II)-dependent dioxygenase YbiX
LKLCNQNVSDVEYNKINLYRFNQYGEGEFINYHEDYDAMSKGAIITMALFLNEGYQGGEFWFKEGDHEYKIEQKMGGVIIFKSDITHKITPVASGTRYSINCWPKYIKLNKTLI